MPAMRAPWTGGLEYIGRIKILIWERTLSASSLELHVTDTIPALSPEKTNKKKHESRGHFSKFQTELSVNLCFTSFFKWLARTWLQLLFSSHMFTPLEIWRPDFTGYLPSCIVPVSCANGLLKAYMKLMSA